MGVLTRSLEVVKKSLTFYPVTSNAWSYIGLAGERGYGEDVGDGSNSSLVEACILWIAKQFTATVPTVRRYDSVNDSDFGQLERSHPAGRLVRQPTYEPRMKRSYYSWHPLIQATITSLTVSGNAYWRKRRSATGMPVQLWYLPHWMVSAERNERSSYFVDYYEVRSGAKVERVKPEDIIHFRDGLDANNPLLGVSPLRTLLREIFTDEEAARWTASLLKKQGVPGIILAPDTGAAPPTEDEAKLIKERLMADFTGDRRGEPMVLGGPTKIHQYGFSPEQMKLGELRDIPEERVSAVLGIPAAVVGFGSGLQTAKVGATMGELIDLGWQNGVLPRARLIAAELTEQLLPDFGAGENAEFVFDTSGVPIMADYQAKIAEKHERLVRSSIELKSEARRAVGLKATTDDEVYMIQAGVTAVLADGKPQIEPPKPEPAQPPVTPALPAPEQPALPAPKALTPREADVVRLIARGLSTKAIAKELGISDRTVERHVASLMEKADVDSRAELVGWLGDSRDEPQENPDIAALRFQISALSQKLATQTTDPNVLRLIERSESNVLRLVAAIDASAQQRESALAGGFLEVAKSLHTPPPAVIRTEMEVERDENGRVLRSRTVAIPEES